MRSQLLIGAGIIALTLTGLLVAFNGNNQKMVQSSEPKQTRDYLQLCIIRSCYTFLKQCANDADCKTEMLTLNAAYLADYTQYDTLVASVQSPILAAGMKCENDCGAREYLEDCGSVQGYINSCPNDAACVAENQDYFDNAQDCSTRQYKACNGLEGDAYDICYQTELVYCFSDGVGGSNTKYEDAILCA